MVIRAAPTSTTNITGFFATSIGLSFTNDSLVARFTISGSNNGRERAPREISCAPSCLDSCLLSIGGALAVGIFFNSSFSRTSEQFAVEHLQMLNDGAKRERGEIGERAHDDHGPYHQKHEQRTSRR